LKLPLANHLPPEADCISQPLLELSEHEKCSFKTVVHCLPESSSAKPADRIADDTKFITEIILPLALSLPPNLKLFRSGGINAKQPRPLKIHFSAKESALQFVSDFNTSKRSFAGPPPAISVVRDRTTTDRFHSYDVIILTDTWLNPDILSNELRFSNFHIYRHDRDPFTSSLTRGGGVLIALRAFI